MMSTMWCPVRIQLAEQTEVISGSGDYPEGGLLLRRTTETPLKQLYGSYFPQAILQRTIHGASSVRTRVNRATPMGNDARFYPVSIENFFVGQSFNINDGPKVYVVKSIGWDATLLKPYFTADVNQNVAVEDLLGSKHFIGVLALTSEDHCSNQAAALAIQKFAYGPGDAFGCMVSLNYLGNIMSAEGDEGGLGYTAELWHDPRNFHGQVDSFDAATGLLKYKPLLNTVLNSERLATGLPLINLNPTKWVTQGQVRIYISNTYPNSQSLNIGNGVIQGVNTQWGPELVGRYFAVKDPNEYLDPKDGRIYTNQYLEERTHYLWYRIMQYMVDPMGNHQLLFVRQIDWGTAGGAPFLMNGTKDYYTYNQNATLNYIIAPGAIVSDVSKGVNENDNNLGECTLVLQPNGDFNNSQYPEYPFAADDEVEQAIGAQPNNPGGFRARHFGNIPSLMREASFEAINLGTAKVGAGFRITNGFNAALIDLTKQFRGGVAFDIGVHLNATTRVGIQIDGDVSYQDQNTVLLGAPPDPQTHLNDSGIGICLMQQNPDGSPPYNKKTIAWSTTNRSVFATMGFEPDLSDPKKEKGEFYLRGGRVRVEGLAASTTAAGNLRGINVTVSPQVMTLAVPLDLTELDANYAIQVTASWLTQVAVTNKTTTSFTVLFDTPAPAGASIDWFLVR